MKEIPRRARIVCDQVVMCPLRRADTEVETCWRCPWIQKIDTAERYVLCEPPFASLPLAGVGPSRA